VVLGRVRMREGVGDFSKGEGVRVLVYCTYYVYYIKILYLGVRVAVHEPMPRFNTKCNIEGGG
jgi:hypothetical protein